MSRKRKKREYTEPQDTRRKEQKIKVKPVSENQLQYILSIRNNTFTIALGHAGSGKTFCAVGMALRYLFSPVSPIKKIVVIRPAIPACDDNIGHLPGDAYEKMYPYFGSILDNLEQFLDKEKIKELLRKEQIEIIPLSFLRGRTLKDCFIIVEEAQNVSIEGMKMVLTRVGVNSKIVVIGDSTQKDKSERDCGLLDAKERFKDCNDFGIIFLYNKEDIVRNPITAEIIRRYEIQ